MEPAKYKKALKVPAWPESPTPIAPSAKAAPKAARKSSAKPSQPARLYPYVVKLIHRVHDWDCELKFAATDSKQARKWATAKMAQPSHWLVVAAKRAPSGESMLT